MHPNILTKMDIAQRDGLDKTHFLNANSQRMNKSLGDLTGLTGFGIHLIEVQPGKEFTEFHILYFEDECTFKLSGTGKVVIFAHPLSLACFKRHPLGTSVVRFPNAFEQVIECVIECVIE